MEDNQELMMKTTLIITGENDSEINTLIAAGGTSSTEPGFVPEPVKVEGESNDDEDIGIQIKKEVLEDETIMRDSSEEEDRKEEKMDVDHAHVMENDLDVDGAVPLVAGGDKTPSMMTDSAFPNNPVQVEEENSFTNGEAEMSSEETISSSSLTSPNGFLEVNGKSGNPTGRVSRSNDSSNCESGPEETALQVNELEEQVKALHDLLILKEKEWNVILRLKKHTEYVLEQVKCGQRRAKAQTNFDGKLPMTDADKETWMSLISTSKVGSLKNAEQKIKDDIEKLESRYIAMEKAFPLGSRTSMPKLSLQGRDSVEIGGKNSFAAATSKPQVNSENKVMIKQKPTLKPAPKLPVSKSLASSPSTALASQAPRMNMNRAADLRPFMRTLRDIAANKSKLKTTAFKPVRMTGADRRFRYQKVIEKLKVEANKLRKAANSSGNHSRAAVQVQQPVKPVRSKPSRQPTQQTASSSERSVLVTFSTGERNVVSQQNYRQETAVPVVPICQGCHAAPSEYMCSLCKDQWYCSRECQLKDWGEHSEFCS